VVSDSNAIDKMIQAEARRRGIGSGLCGNHLRKRTTSSCNVPTTSMSRMDT
jgi:hypothetical protein